MSRLILWASCFASTAGDVRALITIYGLCPYMVFGSGFPVPTVLNPIYGLWVWFLCPTVLNPIYGLWVWFPYPNCVESYGLWVRFPCPTVLSPIYGLCPYMVSGSGFPANCVKSYRLLGLIFLSHCVESHIWSLLIYGLCPYMVFVSGFPANCVEFYRLLGLIFLSHCVESHIWSLPIYGLWVWFSCQLC